MKESKNGLNDRDLEILDILGFDGETDFVIFLKKILRSSNIFELHNRGVALRSLIKILKIELHNQGIPLRSIRLI